MSYDDFAERVVEGGLIADPWYDGAPRFREAPLVLDAARWRSLARAAERVAAVYDELCGVALETPSLLEEFFGLAPAQRAMFLASGGLWHGVARADVFIADGAPTVAELNCDTPTGSPEATELARLTDRAGHLDPNDALRARFLAMADALTRATASADAPRRVGIVYPTEIPEDLSLVKLYRRWFRDAGWDVTLGSPFNLDRDGDGPATLFDKPLGLLVRHYKTDWWGERASPWLDEDIPDAAPLTQPLQRALGAFVDGRTAVLNPFGAVLPQNKRAMAFMWEHVHRFSPDAQRDIERYVPYSARVEALHPEQLRAQRGEWVLKSDYGAEGEEVILGPTVTQAEWERCLRLARPGRWIAQRWFEVERDAGGEAVNHGVFLVAGEASGLYLRASSGPTDAGALSVPALVRAQ